MRLFSKSAESSASRASIDEQTLTNESIAEPAGKAPAESLTGVDAEYNSICNELQYLFLDARRTDKKVKYAPKSWIEEYQKARALALRAIDLAKQHPGLDVLHIAHRYLSRGLFSLPFWPPEDALELLDKIQTQTLDKPSTEAVQLAVDAIDRMAMQLRVAARYHKDEGMGNWRWKPVMRSVSLLINQEAATFEYDPNGVEGPPL